MTFGRSTESVTAALAEANARFMEAFARGDAAAVAQCYTADAQLLPANSEPVTGRDAIQGFWMGAMGMGITAVRLETVEAEGAEDRASEVGAYTLQAGPHVADRGKYIVLWRHDGGAWRLHRDIWTTSQPAATPA